MMPEETMRSAWEGIKQQIEKNIPAEEILKGKPKRKAAKSWLESLWEDLPDADTADWGPLEEHIEMGYDFGYSLPVRDVKETVDNQLVVFEKYDEKVNADWIIFMLADAIENSKWDSARCKDEMSGDPSHLIALCRLGLNDGIDDLYRLFPEAKKVTPEQLKEWRDRGVSIL